MSATLSLVNLAPARSPREKAVRERALPWFLPLLLLLGVFYLYPIVDVVRLSFTNATSMSEPYRYSLSSYAGVLGSPDFAEMARVTGIFVFASVAGQWLLGLLIATLLIAGERRGLPGSGLVRSVVLMGWVLPGVVIGIIWRLILDESGSGIMSYAWSVLGFGNVTFLSAAGPALFWVTLANIWRGTAFSMLMQYSGMKAIPDDVYEAATIDGASRLQQFLFVTLPMLRRVIMINVVLITIATLNTFDMIVPLTMGGPGRATEVIALYIYNVVFTQFALGRGAATAVLLMLAGFVLTLLYFRLLRAGGEEAA